MLIISINVHISAKQYYKRLAIVKSSGKKKYESKCNI